MAEQTVNIQFKAVEILSKTLLARPENLTTAPDKFNFNIKVDSKVNPNEKLLITTVEIRVIEFEKENVFATLQVGCAFQVENFAETILQEGKGKYNIPSHLDAFIRNISISTARGVLFSEFRGTYLYNAILPLVVMQPPPDEVEKGKAIKKMR
jgi:hypothetical protein